MRLIPFPCASTLEHPGPSRDLLRLTHYGASFSLHLLSSQQAGMAAPATAQDLLIPKESWDLWKLGPKNLRRKSAARGGMAPAAG